MRCAQDHFVEHRTEIKYMETMIHNLALCVDWVSFLRVLGVVNVAEMNQGGVVTKERLEEDALQIVKVCEAIPPGQRVTLTYCGDCYSDDNMKHLLASSKEVGIDLSLDRVTENITKECSATGQISTLVYKLHTAHTVACNDLRP